eukprot:jgi/Chlat1/7089/Chrsp57S06780
MPCQLAGDVAVTALVLAAAAAAAAVGSSLPWRSLSLGSKGFVERNCQLGLSSGVVSGPAAASPRCREACQQQQQQQQQQQRQLPSMATWIGALQLFIFYCAWIGGSLFPLVMLVLLIHTRDIRWLTIPVAYYSYRTVHPKQQWPAVHQWMRCVTRDHPYMRTQKVVLEGGEDSECRPRPGSRTMLAFHPHGCLTVGWCLNGNMGPAFHGSGIKWLVADALWYMPVIGDMLAWFNSGQAGRESLLRSMKAGENVALLPGGFEEAALYKHGAHRVYIKRRKGFVKYCMQNGYRIQPIPGVLFVGLWGTFMPLRNVDLVTVVGSPMEVPHIKNPSKEEIEKCHSQYVTKLKALFDKYKKQYAADPNADLYID